MLHHRPWRLLLPFLALVLTAPVALSQGNPVPSEHASTTTKAKPATGEAPAAAEKAPAAKEDRRVIIENADDYRYDPTTKMHYLRGHVVFTTRDMRMTCDAADYNADADTMKASGNLRASDKSSVITGDLMEADFGREVIVVTGNVTVVAQKKPESQKVKGDTPATALSVDKGARKDKPAAADGRNPAPQTLAPEVPDGKTDTKRPPERFGEYSYKRTVITCEHLEYFYGDDQKRMVATPRVKAVQEERTVFADQAVYEDIPRLVTLTGNVIVEAKNGDELHCIKAVVALDDDWVKAEKISGVTLRKAKEGGESKPPEATPPAEGAATGEKPAAEGSAPPKPQP